MMRADIHPAAHPLPGPPVLTERQTLALVLALFVCLGLWYSLVVPPFETPDEVYHYAFARHLAQGHGLPVQTVEADGPWAHEGTQAPLYYFLVGRLTAGIDQSDFDQLSTRNPYANLGNPLYPGNKNFTLYGARSLPLRGTNLALHIGRWFSLALGCITLWLVYRIARLALPKQGRLAWLALLGAAAIPQFAFISASLTNDSLVIMLSTAVVYWLARLLAKDERLPVAWWEWSVLGILLGLAALSKLQALGLFILAGLAGLWILGLRRSWRSLPVVALLVALPALAIAGWWFWRNHVLYGEWLGINRLLTINGLRDKPPTWRGFLAEMRGLRYSFWGLFGWFSILLPTWIYRVLDALTLLAAGGLLLRMGQAWRSRHLAGWWRAPKDRVKALLGAWSILLVGLMFYWASFATSSQGRLLFPALGALAVLFSLGLSAWLELLPGARRDYLLAPLPLGLLACSLFALVVMLPSAYRAPVPVTSVPANARNVNLVYNQQIELIAATAPAGRYRAGDSVPVTLYMRAKSPITSDYPLFVQLLDQNRQVVGNVTTHPGWGRNPTTLWQPGAIYEDRYLVQVERSPDASSPVLGQVYAGFMDAATRNPLPCVDAGGAEVDGMLATVQLLPSALPDASALGLHAISVTFGETIRLAGYRYPESAILAKGSLQVGLLWEATGTPATDYTSFVHLTGPTGRQVGIDKPPAEDRLPTQYWQPGDRILNTYTLALPSDLPAGTYNLWVGLYTSASQGAERLPVAASGFSVQDQQLLLGTIELH